MSERREGGTGLAATCYFNGVENWQAEGTRDSGGRITAAPGARRASKRRPYKVMKAGGLGLISDG